MSEIESLLLGKMAKEELDSAVATKIEGMHGLVDREKAMLIIATEKGLVKKEKTRIGELKDGMKGICLEAKVDYVSSLVRTQKSSFRDIGLESQDGKSVLRLWGTKYDEYRLIHGDEIELDNCSFSYNAIQLGNGGTLRILKRGAAISAEGLAEAKEGIVNVKGAIQKKPEGYFLVCQFGEVPVEVNEDIPPCDVLLERFSWDRKELRQTGHSRIFKKLPSVKDSANKAP